MRNVVRNAGKAVPQLFHKGNLPVFEIIVVLCLNTSFSLSSNYDGIIELKTLPMVTFLTDSLSAILCNYLYGSFCV